MSFLGVAAARSRRSDDRSASPGARIDAAADILAELRVLERDEEDDSYSLLDGASVGGSIPRDIPVHQARDRQPRSAAAGSGGNGGEFSFATPLQHGSRRLIQSGGWMSSGQGQGIGQGQGTVFRGSPRASPFGMSGRPSSSGSSTGGPSKLLGPVFIDDDFVHRKCCGFIGSSAFFCLRDKVADTGFASCKTRAHADRKFEPVVDSFYPPIGTYYNGPAANSGGAISINTLTRAQQAKLMDARYTREQWVKEFNSILGEERKLRLATESPAVVEAATLLERDQISLAYMSTTGSVLSGGLDDEEEAQLHGERLHGVDAGFDDSLESVRIAMQRLREDTARGFRELQDSMRATAISVVSDETGELPSLLARYGSMENVISAVTDPQLRLLDQSFHTAMGNLEQRVARAQAGTGVIKLFRRMVEEVNRRHDDSERRMQHLEELVNQRGFPQPSSERVDETVMIGGRQVPASKVAVLQMIRELETRVDVLTARAKHGGVTIGDKTFQSEVEFQAFWHNHDPAGNGLAACVDFIALIEGFGAGENLSTQDFLNTNDKSRRVNLRMGEAAFGASFKRRYLECIAGKTSNNRIASSVTLPILKKWTDWMGNGHSGDGFKDSIGRMVDQACINHRQYLDDAGLPDELKSLARKTADVAKAWWLELANYLDNEYLMLDSYKLASDQILLLLSQQLVQIFEDIYEVRAPAGNTDITNRSSAVVRYGWATLQAHSVMASYSEAKFRDHRSIAGTFIRFLTRNLVDQSAMGLNSTVTSLQNEVKKLQEELKKRVTVDTFNKLDGKVSALKGSPKKE